MFFLVAFRRSDFRSSDLFPFERYIYVVSIRIYIDIISAKNFTIRNKCVVRSSSQFRTYNFHTSGPIFSKIVFFSLLHLLYYYFFSPKTKTKCFYFFGRFDFCFSLHI